MDDHTQVFVRAYDEQLDAVLTLALRHTEWADEAADVAGVVLVELWQRIAEDSGALSLAWLGERVDSLCADRVGARAGSAFLDRHLPPAYDVLRRPLGDLGDALEDLALDPGDAVDTSTGPGAIHRAALRGAIVAAGSPRPRWWRR